MFLISYRNKPQLRQYVHSSVQPNAIQDLHDDYDDEKLSPKYTRNPINIVFNKGRSPNDNDKIYEERY
jgi:hypothetical protein